MCSVMTKSLTSDCYNVIILYYESCSIRFDSSTVRLIFNLFLKIAIHTPTVITGLHALIRKKNAVVSNYSFAVFIHPCLKYIRWARYYAGTK